MKTDITGVWKEAGGLLWKTGGRIFTTHLAYTVLGVVLFAPLAGILGRLLLLISGQPALADQDIVWFLLTPFGMAALILFSALLVAIAAFEQASLMAVGAGKVQGLHIGVMQALYFTARRAGSIFSFTIRLVTRVLIITLHLLAAGGAVAWFLITD